MGVVGCVAEVKEGGGGWLRGGVRRSEVGGERWGVCGRRLVVELITGLVAYWIRHLPLKTV